MVDGGPGAFQGIPVVNDEPADNGEQAAFLYNSGLPPRCLPHPSRVDSRRVTKEGKVGSQKTTRDMLNTSWAHRRGVHPNPSTPISEQDVRSAFTLVRQHLYGTCHISRGELLYSEIQYTHTAELIKLRRSLEKRIPELCLARGSWAADNLIKEVLRRDKKRGGNKATENAQETVPSSSQEHTANLESTVAAASFYPSTHQDFPPNSSGGVSGSVRASASQGPRLENSPIQANSVFSDLPNAAATIKPGMYGMPSTSAMASTVPIAQVVPGLIPNSGIAPCERFPAPSSRGTASIALKLQGARRQGISKPPRRR